MELLEDLVIPEVVAVVVAEAEQLVLLQEYL
jgi:hypothetical protein